MSRTAGEYIQMVVHPDYVTKAVVMVSHAKKGIHVPLLPHQEMPPDDENTEIFIRIPDTA